MKSKSLILSAILLFSIGVSAQTDSVKTKFIIDLPLVDLPANIDHNGLAYKQFSPSMQQSLGISKSIAEAQQYYTYRLFFNPNKKYSTFSTISRSFWFGVTDYCIEVIIGGTPLGTGWTHEEWHRAVMNKNNVGSFNDMNTFPIGKTAVAVSHETDQALAQFKETNNTDFLRMQVAGIEAQYEYIKAVQKDNFYHNLGLKSSISYWTNALNSIFYVQMSSTTEGDELTKNMMAEEAKLGYNKTEIRDFTGLDFTGWMYDLSRPYERYANRGYRADGGINRYRTTADLTPEELGYLHKMGKMQWINIISPTMFFINSINVNKNLRLNFAMFHYLTSFGYDAGSNFFVDYKNNKMFFALHNYHNFKNSFWGVEAQLLDKQVYVGATPILLTPSIHFWAQPKDQAFRTSDMQLGAKVELSASTMLSKVWQPYITVSAKTTGWVAGDVYLDNNVSARVGIRAYIH
jgi:hypothetical protein